MEKNLTQGLRLKKKAERGQNLSPKPHPGRRGGGRARKQQACFSYERAVWRVSVKRRLATVGVMTIRQA